MEARQIYIAPFLAAKEDARSSPCGSKIAAFRKAVLRQDWPYDVGDDPSFYQMRKFGQLSWGVCCQDVRNPVRPGDIVVFFSCLKSKETGNSEYRLYAVATVERKVRQADIWDGNGPSLRKFRNYFNLLIRPATSIRGGWEHFEPALTVHDDWLWRIADRRRLRTYDFDELEETNRLEPGATIRGRPLEVAHNYVIFWRDHDKTRVLSRPPLVARHFNGKAHEIWGKDSFTQAVQRMTLDAAKRVNGRRRWLRIRNSQRPHRHIVFELLQSEAENWRDEFLDLLSKRK